MIKLRIATEEDYPILCKMAKTDKFVKDFPAISYRWGWKNKVVVAVNNNNIVGFYYANICKNLPRATLYEIYICPNARKCGVGTLLLKNLIDRAIMAGKTEIRWLLNKKNGAYHFYKKNGFLPVEEDEKHYKYRVNISHNIKTLNDYFINKGA